MGRENTVFVLQMQLSKSMGNRGHGYAVCLSGASGAVSPAQPLPKGTTAGIREVASLQTRSSQKRGEKQKSVCQMTTVHVSKPCHEDNQIY